MTKTETYQQVLEHCRLMVADETDTIAVMSTIACELYHAFDYYNWVGFYRRVDADTLKVGPYQGSHGCLTIDVQHGVCGACVRSKQVQLENDVTQAADHIACSSETKAEIVLPILDAAGYVVAVMDIDAVALDAFDDTDRDYLTKIAGLVPVTPV